MSRSLVVLLPFPATPPKGNPFRLLLERSLIATPGLEVHYFSWRTALLGRYDVFHQHWPEILISGVFGPKKIIRQLLYLILLLRLRMQRIPIVRTVHNLDLPQGISWSEAALLRLTDRWTTLRIRINTTTEIPESQAQATILHGHYRDWYDQSRMPSVIKNRILFFGLVRRYKNVPALVKAFRELDSEWSSASLHIAGNPSSTELITELEQLSDGDPWIQLDLRFLSDDEILQAVGAAQLVVLPYREMHNSAGVLTALSLNRPVLVPDNELNRRLAKEVGAGWVHCYQGELTAADLSAILASLERDPMTGTPDLAARDWTPCGPDHLDAYRRACVLAGRPGFTDSQLGVNAPRLSDPV